MSHALVPQQVEVAVRLGVRAREVEPAVSIQVGHCDSISTRVAVEQPRFAEPRRPRFNVPGWLRVTRQFAVRHEERRDQLSINAVAKVVRVVFGEERVSEPCPTRVVQHRRPDRFVGESDSCGSQGQDRKDTQTSDRQSMRPGQLCRESPDAASVVAGWHGGGPKEPERRGTAGSGPRGSALAVSQTTPRAVDRPP